MIMVQSKSLELDFGVWDGYTMNVDGYVSMQVTTIDFKKTLSLKVWTSKNLDSLPPITTKLKIQSYGASPQWGPSHCTMNANI
jgi:hypothetical protein